MKTMKTKEDIVRTLGLANRASKIVYGFDNIYNLFKDNNAVAVFTVKDLEGDSIKQLRSKTSFYNVPLYEILETEDIHKITGKNNIKMIALTDKGFYNLLLK